jgi:hypothetical protein
MRPIELGSEDTKKEPPKSKSINDLYRKTCEGCLYASECPQAYKHAKCPFIGDVTVSLDRATLQKLQVGIAEDALMNLKKYENLYLRGIVDDSDKLDKMRKTAFDILEKLKKDSISEDDTSILDKLGIKSHGQKASK